MVSSNIAAPAAQAPAENPGDAQQAYDQEGEEQQQLHAVNASEAKARQTGWVSKNEWVEQGKDPDDWVSASRYNEKGDMINTLKSLQSKVQESDQRIADNNAIWSARLEVEREKLVAAREEAIDNADRKEVSRLDSEIQNIDKTKAGIDLQKPKPGQQITMTEADPADLLIENTYFTSLSRGKQAFAAQVAGPLLAQGLSGEKLVAAVKQEIELEFPTTNHRRTMTNKMETGRTNQNKAELSVDNLGPDDKATLAALRRSSTKYSGKSDGDLLKILRDSKL